MNNPPPGPPPPPPETSGPYSPPPPWAVELMQRVEELEDIVGSERPPPARGHGLAGEVGELVRRVGDSPDDATGREGSGLCRQVSELVRLHRQAQRGSMRAGAIGAGGAVVIAQVVVRLLELFGNGVLPP